MSPCLQVLTLTLDWSEIDTDWAGWCRQDAELDVE